MKNTLKFLIPLVLLSVFLLPASASAAPTIPPTKECVALMAKTIKKLPAYASDAQEKRAIKPLVSAGCIPKSSFDKIDPAPAEECQVYLDSAVAYLTPINAEAAASPRVKAVMKRAAKIDRRYDKKMRVEDRRLDKAIIKNNQKAIAKISKRMRALDKKETNVKRAAFLSDPKIFNKYLANFYLVSLDLATNGCEPGDSNSNYNDFYENNSTLVKLIFAQY